MEIYSNERKDEILVKDKYAGFPYIIRTLGKWPCAYLGLVDEPDFDVDELDAPVSFTYKSWEWARFDFMDKEHVWLGWDYGHGEDYIPGYQETGHKYTVEEIIEDVKKVIKAYKRKIMEEMFEADLIDVLQDHSDELK